MTRNHPPPPSRVKWSAPNVSQQQIHKTIIKCANVLLRLLFQIPADGSFHSNPKQINRASYTIILISTTICSKVLRKNKLIFIIILYSKYYKVAAVKKSLSVEYKQSRIIEY